MATFLQEDREELYGKSVKMPKYLKKLMTKTFAKLTPDDKKEPGYKEAVHLLQPDYNKRSKGKKTQGMTGRIPFSSLKKLKYEFDNDEPGSPKSELMGGDQMKYFVTNSINKIRTQNKPVPKPSQQKVTNSSVKPVSPVKPVKPNNNVSEGVTKTIIITENQLNTLKKNLLPKNNIVEEQLLRESQESKSIDAAKKLAMQHGYSYEEADKLVRNDIRSYVPFTREKGSKFILGVTRMFLDGQLEDGSTRSALNNTLKYVASDAHINEYDRNLNGMSVHDLINRFAKNVEMDLENRKNKLNAMQFEGDSLYDIVRIDSFEQACEYNKYTFKDDQWCLTYSKDNYNTYTCNGINQIYFCLRKGFENVEPVPGEGCPLDEYGLSMISVIVDENGALAFCTCRWNHSHGGSDSIMDDEQISEEIDMNFYDVFKPNNKWNELLENALQRLRNGENPKEIFDWCSDFHDGFAIVELNGKENLLEQSGNFISPDQWFDNCSGFHEGFARVVLNRKCNLMRKDGSFLLNAPLGQWFDDCSGFYGSLAMVELNEKYNWIRKDGSLLSPKQWFDGCSPFFNSGCAMVKLNGKYNFIGEGGSLLLNKPVEQWFDDCGGFSRGLAPVTLNGEYYYVDTGGSLYDIREKPLGMNVNNVNTQNESISRNMANKMKDIINETIKNTIVNLKNPN